MAQLPELISVDSNGSKRVWKITVSEGKYTIEHGTVGGKMVTFSRNVTVKNIGKVNETSLLSQALSEARSKWNKKIDEGYVSQDQMVESYPKIVRQSVLPMLAQKYDPTKMSFPCSVQPKLDGIRAIYHGGALWSRHGKLFPEVNFIAEQLSDVKAILDGELYCHELSFQEIISAVKKRNQNTSKLQYVVYDIVDDECFPERMRKIQTLLTTKKPNVSILETYRCETKNDVSSYMNKFLQDKYEGMMFRSDTGGYIKKYRSKSLQKYKEFLDSEFTICDFTEGEGSEKGLVLFVCKVSNGTKFTVRPVGSRDHRRALFMNGKSYLGKNLIVRYQELTDSGIPRFPVGIAIRDYE
jgi:DNA ligase-1